MNTWSCDSLYRVIRLVIDSVGVVKDRYSRYFAYGGGESQTISTGQKYRYTGQPYDDDGAFDLYYYGARYYDPVLGRFTSRDQLAQKYPSWSPYAYTIDNPLKYIDQNGAWSTEIHNQILGRALGDLVTPEEMTTLQEASAYVDKFQSPEYNYLHAMRSPGQSVEDAQKAMANFVKARTYEFVVRAGDNPLFQLGRALHPLMDQTSPAHEGFQVWNGLWPPSNALGAYRHREREKAEHFTLDRHWKATTAVRQQYLMAIEQQRQDKESREKAKEHWDEYDPSNR